MRSITSDYNKFRDELENIENFHSTTHLSYCLAHKMLIDSSEEEIITMKQQIGSPNEKISYSVADGNVKGAELVCEWVTDEEYAKRYKISLEMVKEKAENKELGYVIYDNGILYVIWPKEEQKTDAKALPGFNRKEFRVSFSRTITRQITLVENVQSEILSLMNNPETKEILNGNAVFVLNENCLLSIWSAFEFYIKNVKM